MASFCVYEPCYLEINCFDPAKIRETFERSLCFLLYSLTNKEKRSFEKGYKFHDFFPQTIFTIDPATKAIMQGDKIFVARENYEMIIDGAIEVLKQYCAASQTDRDIDMMSACIKAVCNEDQARVETFKTHIVRTCDKLKTKYQGLIFYNIPHHWIDRAGNPGLDHSKATHLKLWGINQWNSETQTTSLTPAQQFYRLLFGSRDDITFSTLVGSISIHARERINVSSAPQGALWAYS